MASGITKGSAARFPSLGAPATSTSGPVVCSERLGGLLESYYRDVA